MPSTCTSMRKYLACSFCWPISADQVFLNRTSTGMFVCGPLQFISISFCRAHWSCIGNVKRKKRNIHFQTNIVMDISSEVSMEEGEGGEEEEWVCGGCGQEVTKSFIPNSISIPFFHMTQNIPCLCFVFPKCAVCHGWWTRITFIMINFRWYPIVCYLKVECLP